jgi:hypothetical protein
MAWHVFELAFSHRGVVIRLRSDEPPSAAALKEARDWFEGELACGLAEPCPALDEFRRLKASDREMASAVEHAEADLAIFEAQHRKAKLDLSGVELARALADLRGRKAEVERQLAEVKAGRAEYLADVEAARQAAAGALAKVAYEAAKRAFLAAKGELDALKAKLGGYADRLGVLRAAASPPRSPEDYAVRVEEVLAGPAARAPGRGRDLPPRRRSVPPTRNLPRRPNGPRRPGGRPARARCRCRRSRSGCWRSSPAMAPPLASWSEPS